MSSKIQQYKVILSHKKTDSIFNYNTNFYFQLFTKRVLVGSKLHEKISDYSYLKLIEIAREENI